VQLNLSPVGEQFALRVSVLRRRVNEGNGLLIVTSLGIDTNWTFTPQARPLFPRPALPAAFPPVIPHHFSSMELRIAREGSFFAGGGRYLTTAALFF
jgi:hypothetical protein